MRIKLKAVLKKADEVTKKNDFMRQRILLEVPVYDQFTGDILRTEYYPAAILGANIDKCQAHGKVGEIVSAICFLSSFAKEHEGETFYNLSLNCVELNLFTG